MPEGVLTEVNRELDRWSGRASKTRSTAGSAPTWTGCRPSLERALRGQLRPQQARQILDEDHTGLSDVKDRIIEFLAVRKLRKERGLEVLSGRDPARSSLSSDLPALARPRSASQSPAPWDASSLESRSAASATRLTSAATAQLRRRSAGSHRPRVEGRRHEEPVIMLDEIDKVGSDWRGDPSSALLECSTRPDVAPLLGSTRPCPMCCHPTATCRNVPTMLDRMGCAGSSTSSSAEDGSPRSRCDLVDLVSMITGFFVPASFNARRCDPAERRRRCGGGADVSLVADAAERDSSELASQGAGD